jgi:hypothetical protein
VRLNHAAPRVGVTVDAVEPDLEPGRWRVAWVIRNEGADTIALESAWVPHGRFRGEGRLSIDHELEAGESRRLEFRVAAREAPSTVVENAFLILRARSQEHGWRIFTRMRVEFDSQGVPRPICELTTVATIGP